MGLLLGLAAASALAWSYDALYAFGDSLTDTGREPSEPLFHFDGRWSNGPLWVEYLSTRLGFSYNPTNNLAHSGAQTDDTLGQVTQFVPTTPVDQSLFVVWAGGNDFLQEYDKYWFDDAGWDGQIAYSVGSLSNAVVTLYGKGARFILVPNTVDVTDIPLLNRLPGFIRDYLRSKVEQFNRELFVGLDRIQLAYPALNLYRIDVFAMVKDFLGHASDLGFTKTHVDALGDVTLLDKRFDGPGAKYVFWDPIHPTSKSHGVVAEWFQSVVAPLSPNIDLSPARGGFDLTLKSLNPGFNYVLQYSSNLARWSDLKSFTSLTSQVLTGLNNELPQLFFRVQRVP
jgi:phospholipase/lecithinase/hemolysin